MSIHNIKKNLVRFGILIIFSSILISSNLFVSANILVTPKNTNEEKSLFFKTKAGETILESFDITNTDQNPATFDLQANDIIVTEDGTVTLAQNKEERKSLASWMKILTGSVTLDANAKVTIPLQITVPSDAKAGEYGAAFSILNQNLDTSNSGIKNSTRKGLKVYVFVTDENLPLISSTINNLNLLNLDSSDRLNYEKKLNFWDKNNMVFSFKAEDTGNTYSVLKGTYTVSCADGGEKTATFTTNLVPGNGEKEYFISTNIPYKSGKTTIKLDYTVEALNKTELGEAKNMNVSGSLRDEIDSNEQMITSFRGIDRVQAPVNSENKKVKVVKNLIIILFALVGSFALRKAVKKDKKAIDKE